MSDFIFQNPAAVRRFGSGLIIATSVVLTLLALFVWSFVSNRYDSIEELNATIAQSERLAATSQLNSTRISLYQNDTPQLSQSQMQSDMQELARQYQVSLEVIRADQIEQLQGSIRLALTLNGVVPENQLGGYLLGLAAHEPMIVVDSISLRRARSTNRASDERPLAIQLKLSGFATQ